MDTKAAITKLYEIVAKQNEAIRKLAQAQGAAPVAVAPAQPAASAADPTTKLQAALVAQHPGIQQSFIEMPSVGTSPTGSKHIVSFKYHLGGNAASLKAAVNEAANQTLGAGSFLIQAIGA